MANYNSKNVMLVGLKGADGLGVPAGGTTGQVLKKRSNTDNDTEWANESVAVSSQTVTISVADWNGGTTCTKSVTGVTASNIVFCDSSDSSVQCTAQGSGTLTFTATSTPTAVVTVKVVIF